MMHCGRFVSKFWFLVGPLVVAMLIGFECGWTRAEKSDLPFERMWSINGGRLSREFDYYDANVVEPATSIEHYVSYVDKNVMGDGGPQNGEGGNLLTAGHLAEMLKLREGFYETTVTTSSGNTYTGSDLCERVGTDAPGPVMVDSVTSNLTGVKQSPSGLPGFMYTSAGGGVTDQHRANSYFAFNERKCAALFGGDTTAAAAWDSEWLRWYGRVRRRYLSWKILKT